MRRSSAPASGGSRRADGAWSRVPRPARDQHRRNESRDPAQGRAAVARDGLRAASGSGGRGVGSDRAGKAEDDLRRPRQKPTRGAVRLGRRFTPPSPPFSGRMERQRNASRKPVQDSANRLLFNTGLGIRSRFAAESRAGSGPPSADAALLRKRGAWFQVVGSWFHRPGSAVGGAPIAAIASRAAGTPAGTGP